MPRLALAPVGVQAGEADGEVGDPRRAGGAERELGGVVVAALCLAGDLQVLPHPRRRQGGGQAVASPMDQIVSDPIRLLRCFNLTMEVNHSLVCGYCCQPAEMGILSKQPMDHFCKTLTASDTNMHGVCCRAGLPSSGVMLWFVGFHTAASCSEASFTGYSW